MVDEHAGLTIVFNGEIYNFRELRARLALRHRFATRSDTEVILHAYREWGTACVEHLRGMFSFAIWDERKQTCSWPATASASSRSTRPGWRPFYFASEVKALLPFLPDVRVDYRGFAITLPSSSISRKTLFRDVRELPPATSAWSTPGANGTRPIGRCTTNLILTIPTAGSAIVARNWWKTRFAPPGGRRAAGQLLERGHRFQRRGFFGPPPQDPGRFVGFPGRFADGPGYDESPTLATGPPEASPCRK